MFLSKIRIENFRILKDVEITLDRNLTLFVGKNNTGKTSIMDAMMLLLDSKKKTLDFDDYPLLARQSLYSAIDDYWRNHDITVFLQAIPIVRITLTLDYSDGEIGNADSFVIDLDEEINYAIVRISFDVSSGINELLDRCKEQYDKSLPPEPSADDMRNCMIRVVRDYIGRMFDMTVVAVNPSNERDVLEKQKGDLLNLFNLKVIRAERNMDESDSDNRNPIGQLMKRLFDMELADVEEGLKPSIEELHKIVDNAKITLQDQINSHMDAIVANMLSFGYPSGEEMQLRANTDLALERRIVEDTQLAYVTRTATESLPESHNGLGYKNLIKITMELHEYARRLKDDRAKLPLLIIEEPEAHMHPQMQTSFVKFLEEFLSREVGENLVQTIMTTHSAHVANTVPFKKVRYILRHSSEARCKSIADFPVSVMLPEDAEMTEEEKQRIITKEKNKRLDFLQKYMKLSYCDLYFCDKAILAEGASERLLLPNMMEKCKNAGDFSGVSIPLTNQYYSIVEVGGAYAHNFYDFVDYLEIPTLILTDIDFVNSDRRKCQINDAVQSSNAAINAWCQSQFPITGAVPISKVLELAQDATKRTEGLKHLEYQMEEHGFHPRSFEEAIINCNRVLFGKSETEELDFAQEGEKKTDFALKLLVDPDFANYQVPMYIREGLIWLNSQSREENHD